MFQYTYKCFQGNVAFAFFGGFPQFPEMASSLGKGHHKNQVQLVTREVPRETCAESDAFLLKLKAVVIRAFKNTKRTNAFTLLHFPLCFSFVVLHFLGLTNFAQDYLVLSHGWIPTDLAEITAQAG